MNFERDVYPLYSCELGSNSNFHKELMAKDQIKNLINSNKIINGGVIFFDKKAYLETPIIKISFDVRFVNEYKYTIKNCFNILVENKSPSQTVWVISIGGTEISFNEFDNVLKLIKSCGNWKNFIFSIEINENWKYEIENYLLFVSDGI